MRKVGRHFCPRDRADETFTWRDLIDKKKEKETFILK